ncbi:iron chelate uptake ABC transporter family permease subunit [Streptococcus sp. S784/96/1]|uniref:iron chelate uptake ABC transporter family permease subunit n=1 Tax=Streptococcus sp. S784/96/1 TaxID=2653499 RepID=UPI0013866FFD|nr:iron chelate uptake ABC transporter family permease subunit [Streptococcus sp. S784/96/1]
MGKIQSKRQQLLWLLIILAIGCTILYTYPFGGRVIPYILKLRLRKVLTYALVAVIASFSTISFQTITGNRFLTPSVLGLESLYVLMQSVYLFFYWKWIEQQAPNPIVEFLVVLLIQLLFFGLFQPIIRNLLTKGFGTILLICMSLGTLFRSFSTYLQVLMDPNEYDKLQSKLFASLQHVNTDVLAMATVLVVISTIFLYRKSAILNVFYLGKSNATLLGIDVEKTQQTVLWIVVLLVSASTAMVGPMTFFGFMLVNIVHQLLNYYEHKWLFGVASLLGFVILVIGQGVLERLFNYQITIAMLVELLGGAFFFYLLYKERMKS